MTRPVWRKIQKKVFNSRQVWHFFFVDIIIKVFSLLCTLNWVVNNHVSRQGKKINRLDESKKTQVLFDTAVPATRVNIVVIPEISNRLAFSAVF